jgi:GNAT superfamily N-acetyltransferase
MRPPPPFSGRGATVADSAALARHRAEMFRDMGVLPDDRYAELVDAYRHYLTEALPSGEYVGWVATPVGSSGEIVAGAGVQLRRVLPGLRRVAGRVEVATGLQGIVVNVFTERAWRRQGAAELLMHHLLDWARDRGLGNLVLHASDEGRPLYERLGFVPTNEMRLARDP